MVFFGHDNNSGGGGVLSQKQIENISRYTSSSSSSSSSSIFKSTNHNPSMRPNPLLIKSPNTWSLLINHLSSLALSEESFSLYKGMKERKLIVEGVVYTSLFRGVSVYLALKRDDYGGGDGLYKRARKLFMSLQLDRLNHLSNPSSSPSKSNPSKYSRSRYDYMSNSAEYSSPPMLSIEHINAMLQCSSRMGDYSEMFGTYLQMSHLFDSSSNSSVNNSSVNNYSVNGNGDSDVELKRFLRDYRRRNGSQSQTQSQSQSLVNGEGRVSGLNLNATETEYPEWMSTNSTNTPLSSNPPNPPTLNSLATPHTSPNPPHPPNLLRSPLEGLQPDTQTYTILLTACARRGGTASLTDAEHIWTDLMRDLKAFTASKTSSSYASLSSAFGSFGSGGMSENVKIGNIVPNNSKNLKNNGRGEEIQMTEQEYLAYMHHIDDLRTSQHHASQSSSAGSGRREYDLSLDTELINAYLMVCKNSGNSSTSAPSVSGGGNGEKGYLKALAITQRYFTPRSIDMTGFQDWLRSPNTQSTSTSKVSEEDLVAWSKLMQKVTAMTDRTSHSTSNDEEEMHTMDTLTLPDSKTLSILMNILETKLSISPKMTSLFMQYHTEQVPAHMRIRKDAGLEVYNLRLRFQAGDYANVAKQCKSLIKSASKSSIVPLSFSSSSGSRNGNVGNGGKLTPVKYAAQPEIYDLLIKSLSKMSTSEHEKLNYQKQQVQNEEIKSVWMECQDLAHRRLRVRGTGEVFKPISSSFTNYLASLTATSESRQELYDILSSLCDPPPTSASRTSSATDIADEKEASSDNSKVEKSISFGEKRGWTIEEFKNRQAIWKLGMAALQMDGKKPTCALGLRFQRQLMLAKRSDDKPSIRHRH